MSMFSDLFFLPCKRFYNFFVKFNTQLTKYHILDFVNDNCTFRSMSILLCIYDMALALSSRELNFINAMFFSSEFIKISIFSG
jgi:hypothetical protein